MNWWWVDLVDWTFVSRASILVIRVAILASATMDDSIGALLLKLQIVNSLVFPRLAPIVGFSQLNSHINPNPVSHPSTRSLPDTWFLKKFSFDNLSYRREFGTDAISPHHSEGTELEDL